jgi:hypothetical protein
MRQAMLKTALKKSRVAKASEDAGAISTRFCVFDGMVRVVIEVECEDEARELCKQMRWVLIGPCEG